MYANILIPTDGSECADKAVEHGVIFAKQLGAKVTAVTVTEPFRYAMRQFRYSPTEYTKHAEKHAATVLDYVAVKADLVAVACDTVHIEHDQVYQAIIDTAVSKGCDLIIMASHGRRGVSAVVLASETLKVLTHSKIPVLVYR